MLDEVKAAWREFGGDLQKQNLPSAPEQLVLLTEDPFLPQVRLDRDAEGGMSTVVLSGVRYLLVSHNTRMGTACGAILVAERAGGS